jgi:L-cysteine/cystine lyase
MDMTQLRRKIPALQDAIYLNTGTFGPSPKEVLDEVRYALDLIEKHGPFSPIVRQTVEQTGYEWARSEAAKLLGATVDEIYLSRSTSDAINTIAYGLDWHQGDEVVISDEEHQSGILPWLILSQRMGINVRIAAVDCEPEVTLQNFAEQITPRTRLLFTSHVSGISGIRLPVCQICSLAHDNGVLAVIDGAHALGQFPVDVGQIGCDAYVGCGHKWLLGPQGTSLAYITREHLDTTFKPSWSGWGAQEKYSLDLATQTFTLQDSARKYEFGTKPWLLYPALAKAIYFIRNIGLLAIEEQVRPLVQQLKEKIDMIPGWQRLTPMVSDCSTGLVSFRINQDVSENFPEMLWEQHRLLVAYWPPDRRMRFSVAFFTTQDEIDRAVAAIQTMTT